MLKNTSKETVLSLDVSTKTGFAVLSSDGLDYQLLAYGQLPKISEPEGSYPGNYVVWAYSVFKEISILVDRFAPDVLVIEETASGSKNVYSQKILEFCHMLIAKMIYETGIKSLYFMTEEWRRLAGCQMTKEESKHNKSVKKYKDKNSTSIAYDEKGKRVGKLTRKHINVRRANEVFGEFLREPLRMKDEDTADALLLAFTFHAKKIKGVANGGI